MWRFLITLSFIYIYHQIPKFNVDLTLTKFTHLKHFSIGVIDRSTFFSVRKICQHHFSISLTLPFKHCNWASARALSWGKQKTMLLNCLNLIHNVTFHLWREHLISSDKEIYATFTPSKYQSSITKPKLEVPTPCDPFKSG
jgi:hypothetical protein